MNSTATFELTGMELGEVRIVIVCKNLYIYISNFRLSDPVPTELFIKLNYLMFSMLLKYISTRISMPRKELKEK